MHDCEDPICRAEGKVFALRRALKKAISALTAQAQVGYDSWTDSEGEFIDSEYELMNNEAFDLIQELQESLDANVV